MIEESVESSDIVQITLCTSEGSVATLVKESSQPDFAETQIVQLGTIADFAASATKSPDVFIVDVSNAHDVESLFASNARKLLAHSEIIVLCDAEDADKWQQYVLRQEISDCFIIRPVHDPGYLKVQIWRAIRSQMPLGNDDDKKAETVFAHANQKPDLQFSGLRVLVLEDDAPSAEFITDMLIEFGFSVEHAPSVNDAVQKYKGRKFDLYLVDLMMPGISGSDVIRTVRDTLNDTAAPIIVMSAFSDDDLVQDCISEGATDYVIKPITRSRLYPRLVSALESRRL